jgi:uncharacterized membrane protein
MALGHYLLAELSQTTDDRVEQRLQDVRLLFSATDYSEITRVLGKYSIDYIYIGPFEERRYPGVLQKYRNRPYLFEEVYSQEGVSIFAYHAASPYSNQGNIREKTVRILRTRPK